MRCHSASNFLFCLGVGWREDVGPVLPPHLPAHDAGVIGSISNDDGRRVVDEASTLLGVVGIGGRKEDGC